MIATDSRTATRPPATVTPEERTKIRRGLRGDLDNIILKALRKEPERRYPSVEQFAEDVRRHLQGLPVTATPGTLSYRIGKFGRRHRMGVAAVALVTLAIAGGVMATAREARIAEANRLRAEARFNDVRQLANSLLFELDGAIRNLPGSTPARSLLVKRALEYLDGLAAEAHEDRSLQLEIASAYQKVAEVQGDPIFPNLGDSKGALDSSRKSLAILETLSQKEPDNREVRLWIAGSHQQISDVLSFSGDTAGAVEHSGKALKMYESLAGTLASQPKFQGQRVTQTYHYANLLRVAGSLDEAEAEYRQAVELSRQMIAARPSDQEGKVHLAASLDGLGYVLQEKGDTAGALENCREGLAIREELARLDPDNAHYARQLAFSHHSVGLSLVEGGDLANALANFRTELRLFESLSVPDPKNIQARRNQSLAHKQIGDVLIHTDDVLGALAQYRAALNIDRDLSSIDPNNSQAILDLSLSEGKAGSALGKRGQTREGLALLRSAVARQEALIAQDPHHLLLYSELANSYTLLANCLRNGADAKDSIEYYGKAVAERVTLSEKSPNSALNHRALAEGYTNLAKAIEPADRQGALQQYNHAVALLENLTAANKVNDTYRIALAGGLSDVARLYVNMAGQDASPSTRLGYWTEARSFYQRSQELWLGLGRAGKIPPSRGQAIREVNGELTRCNNSLAKLQQLEQ